MCAGSFFVVVVFVFGGAWGLVVREGMRIVL